MGVKEPNTDAVGNEIMEGSISTPPHTEDRDVQLERSASNTEREDGKHGGVSGETDESNRPGEGGDITNAPVGQFLFCDFLSSTFWILSLKLIIHKFLVIWITIYVFVALSTYTCQMSCYPCQVSA